MSSAPQTRAIDFDNAKLQRLGFRQLQNVAQLPADLTQLRQQLGLQLQTSLDAEKILTIFFRGIQRLIPLDGLTYDQSSSDLHLKLGERTPVFASYTLSSEGEHLGELVFQRNRRFAELELTQLESLLTCLLFPLRNALLYRAATQSALRDPLTNTGNRVAMDQTLNREIELARRQKSPLSVLMLDIDHFKRVNDMHGHAVGDEVLKAVAASIKSQLRNVDRVFRFGGEEFLVVLSNTDREAAVMVGERLRQAAQQLTYATPDHPVTLTVSLGGATLLPAESAASLQLRADSALYVAKREGRNRLTMAG
ncbi:GGDEF domain-containing protein [Pseudomonas sp. CCI3.2]|uniref:GGDEF domain-containing protein n=1 Tax=unclassified Pseudomonas TaxID=196821 RepID=UPI002AC92042|nr:MULTISPECIES: GGDEF domain-containing protein [unclassified Pseudomonas]MEB0075914.1 GGDEF domain-containing protein [Pseudomonas sp. MH10out]MEB0091550.1 GGDEF domain-containing protein [Pseudomonas sp. CCI4.2]MEB0101359.1 GGDEF domain-containing protein [Pseudomonas sp. CCI3.2]MEB0130893.1 GGDEF domain-containing protein [Pseudomonas sp. CCI2.4]MEB0156561.1 GGDEF domain-containing protein [Pseudomonas sp. AH2 (2023)]